MNQKVCVVTGGGGFIGSHLTDSLLDMGYSVRVIDKTKDLSNLKTALKNTKFSLFNGDINNQQLLDQVTKNTDCVFHLAAKTDFDSTSYRDYYNNNVLGTIRVIQSCLKNHVSKLIFYSSIGAHGVVSSPLSQNEEVHFPPQSLYGLSKLEAEHELFKIIDRDLKFNIIRPTTVFGPREKMTTLPLIKYLSHLPAIIVNGGKNKVSYVYVADLNKAAISLSQKRCSRQIYVISGKSLTMRELTVVILKNLKKSTRLINLPYWSLLPFAIICTFVSKIFGYNTPLPLRRLNTMCLNYDFKTTKAYLGLGYRPQNTPDKAFRETIHWYQENNLL